MKVSTLLSFVASATIVSAGSSRQLLAFTSAQSTVNGLTLPSASSVSGFVHSLFAQDQLAATCSLDAIALINIQDPHFDRKAFSGLSHSSLSLRARALDAPLQVTFAATQDVSASAALQDAAQLCKSRSPQQVDVQAGHLVQSSQFDSQVLPLVQINVKNLRNEESALMKTLASLDEAYPRNLVVLQGSSNEYLSPLNKRQILSSPLASSGNWTEPTGGVFARYQLFSTPLILTLLLVGGLLFPIVYFAVYQLAQIQTPDQMGVRKDPISGDKKTQ